jgi:asparagine synthetase B (glutamine-hydrolysing)
VTETRLSPLEIASGLVLGVEPTPRTPRAKATDARAALERAVLPALLHPPCLVSFSGGRDSSTVLAVATALARREGLPLPIPATNRFRGIASADEAEWQEQVVAHLGLEDWVCRDFDGELDAVGPVATGVLERHGLLWPFNIHFHVPLIDAAAGGSLLTGIGGDETFGSSRWPRAEAVLARRARPRRADTRQLLAALAPAPARARALRSRRPPTFGWLTEDALREVTSAWAAQAASEPVRWSRRMCWSLSLRYLHVGKRGLELVAGDAGVSLLHPLCDPEFVHAAADTLARATRVADRGRALEILVGDLLPTAVCRRASKAGFDDAFWSSHSRRFVESWSGEGVDPALVDIRALADAWRATTPDPRTFTLLQSAWLARREQSAGGEVEQAPRGVAEALPAPRT